MRKLMSLPEHQAIKCIYGVGAIEKIASKGDRYHFGIVWHGPYHVIRNQWQHVAHNKKLRHS